MILSSSHGSSSKTEKIMADVEKREEIQNALDDLAAEDFTQRAHTFLNILGYKSERTLKTDGTLEALIPKDTPFTKKESEALKHWQEGHLLFQITDGEIKEGLGRASLLKETFDEGREKSFAFISVELEEKTYTRSQIANMVRGLNKAFQMPAVIIFRYGKRATLGVIHQREHKKDENKNVLEKVTLIKDISLENPNRAHIDILAELSLPELVNKYQVRNFDNLLKAWETTLDISELNKRFYKDLVEWFHKACTEVKFPSSKDNPIKPEEHVIRMICRLLFIWFIKEKNLVAEELFYESDMQTLLEKWDKNKGENYYTAILQNLFFATLNTEVDKRAFSKKGQATHRNPNLYRYEDQLKDQDEFLKIIGKTPFINGGLFDCLDSFDAAGKGGYRIDCFTDNNNHRKELSVPNRLFFGEDGLFKLFTRYKFTVEENTPIERDVALDPELLGLTFENLLAEYNPETGETARKQTGSYYTPRQIVDYMADEALTAALAAKVEPYDDDLAWLKDRLRDLLDYGSGGEKDKKDREHLIEEQEIKPLIEAMSRLKVLDPAVGSGAFPMGILNKLVLALEKLDPENKIWKEMQIVHAQQESGKAYQTIDKGETREARLKEINETFEQFSGDFGRKLYLIQNSIFGVDIQTVACQIAKLRVFISLAVEQVGNQKARENYGIRPLPNLETRFVAANSLIGLHQGQLSLARTPKVNEIEQQIKQISDLYFNARTRNKKQEYKQSDTELRKVLADELTANMNLSADEAQQIADWSPYDQNRKASWFDPEWMFGEKQGFDIVIGNPPYVRQEKIEGKNELKKFYGNFFKGTADLYTYFYSRGGDLLKDQGTLCLITSNKFMRAAYGEPLREFLTSDLKPAAVLDFGNKGVFDATTRPLIYIGQKNEANTNFQTATAKNKEEMKSPHQLMAEKGFKMPVASLRKEGWALLPHDWLKLGEKIRRTGIPLKDYVKGQIYRGIITGLNKAFVIDETTRKSLIAADKNSAELIRPLLRGRDLKKWKADWQELYLIFTRRGTNIEKYKAIKKYLLAFRKKLEPETHEGRKPGSYQWYEIQDNIAYYKEFDKPKIIYRNLSQRMCAVFDKKRYLTNQKCYIIPTSDKYLVGLLNSQLMDFFFRTSLPCLDNPFSGGDMEFNKVNMETIPIKEPDAAARKQIEALVDKIHAANQSDPAADLSPLEAQIDKIIYKLYDLTPDEITLIEQATYTIKKNK